MANEDHDIIAPAPHLQLLNGKKVNLIQMRICHVPYLTLTLTTYMFGLEDKNSQWTTGQDLTFTLNWHLLIFWAGRDKDGMVRTFTQLKTSNHRCSAAPPSVTIYVDILL